MSRPHLYDVIRLKEPISEHGLAAGDIGAIVLTFDRPEEAYEVEFVDDYGQTRAMFPLTPDQFEVVWSADSREWVGETLAIRHGAVAVGDNNTRGH